MTRILIGSVVAFAFLGGAATAQSAFVDVSPCHWAAAAVASIAGEPEVDEAQARASVYLAENAVRQVFEGLACGTLEWSSRFLVDIPAGAGPEAALDSFALRDLATSIGGDGASVDFVVDAVIDGESVSRAGRADLVFEASGWRVRYPSLAALELPLFP